MVWTVVRGALLCLAWAAVWAPGGLAQSRTSDEVAAHAAFERAVEAFPRVFGASAWRPFHLRGDDRVELFLDDRTFGVDHGAQGGRSLARTTWPVPVQDGRGGKELVDEDGARLVPRRPVVSVVIGRGAGQGVRLPRAGVAVRPAGVRGTSARRTARLAFFADVLPETDMAVIPEVPGAQVAWLLRSSASPTELRLAVDVPAEGPACVSPCMPRTRCGAPRPLRNGP